MDQPCRNLGEVTLLDVRPSASARPVFDTDLSLEDVADGVVVAVVVPPRHGLEGGFHMTGPVALAFKSHPPVQSRGSGGLLQLFITDDTDVFSHEAPPSA